MPPGRHRRPSWDTDPADRGGIRFPALVILGFSVLISGGTWLALWVTR